MGVAIYIAGYCRSLGNELFQIGHLVQRVVGSQYQTAFVVFRKFLEPFYLPARNLARNSCGLAQAQIGEFGKRVEHHKVEVGHLNDRYYAASNLGGGGI